jgi:hypothetical protein
VCAVLGLCCAVLHSELSAQLAQLQSELVELGESRTALSTALTEEQGQSASARGALSDRMDTLAADVTGHGAELVKVRAV